MYFRFYPKRSTRATYWEEVKPSVNRSRCCLQHSALNIREFDLGPLSGFQTIVPSWLHIVIGRGVMRNHTGRRLIEKFVCLGFFILFENFSLIWRRRHYRRRAAFYVYSALMAIEQWGFFNMTHLLWHGTSVYDGHLRGPDTFTTVAEHLTVEQALPVETTWVCRGWDSNTQPSACEANSLTNKL